MRRCREGDKDGEDCTDYFPRTDPHPTDPKIHLPSPKISRPYHHDVKYLSKDPHPPTDPHAIDPLPDKIPILPPNPTDLHVGEEPHWSGRPPGFLTEKEKREKAHKELMASLEIEKAHKEEMARLEREKEIEKARKEEMARLEREKEIEKARKEEMARLEREKEKKNECLIFSKAKKVNNELLETVRKLEKTMDKHSNNTLQRGMKLKDINNTYSKFPVNNKISYKNFLHKIRESYETGYYQKKLNKLEENLRNFKFDRKLKIQCRNYRFVNGKLILKPKSGNRSQQYLSKGIDREEIRKKREKREKEIIYYRRNRRHIVFIQKNKMKKTNLRNVKSLMNEEELFQAYSLLLQKSISLLKKI